MTSSARWLVALAVGLSQSACTEVEPVGDRAIILEETIAAPRDRVFDALTRVLAARGAQVLFETPELGVLAFEWSREPKRGARSRTIVRLTSSTGDATRLRARTSGYIPGHQPLVIDLGLDVGPKFVGRKDANLEYDLVREVAAMCRGSQSARR